MRSVTKCGFAAALVLALGSAAANSRSLDAISQRGAIALCAHPNALPFASKKGDPPGFQVELGRALADRLGVSLLQHWVVNSFQYRRADCDIVLDAIANKAALSEVGLRMSRPYYRSGVALAVPRESDLSSLAGLGPGRRVGVLVGSLASMTLEKGNIEVSPFVFEDEMLEALARREIAAAAVTPSAIGWYNMRNPDAAVRRIPAFEDDPDLSWNVAVGMLRPDEKLTQRIDAALGELLADGTVARIYARYGIELQPPK
jgi:polar amino acid transport system substrate-binding protein